MVVLSLGFNAGSFAADSAKQSKLQNYDAPGNLESKHDIGCIGANKVDSRYTPPDLYKAMSKCISSGRYEEGAFLLAVAGVYGRFDTFRVADKTAHQAVAVARMQALGALDTHKQTAFQEKFKATLGTPEGLAVACKRIVKIGAPNYYPRYMTQHGTSAFTKSGGGEELVKDFDAKAAWKKSLDTYLHCPAI
jgi:hypothetical protein